MRSGQKVGVVVAVVADALWLVVIIAILATPPDAGANIGAGVLGLLALSLSIVAAIVLITTANSTASGAASAASIALWALFVALAWTYAAQNEVGDHRRTGGDPGPQHERRARRHGPPTPTGLKRLPAVHTIAGVSAALTASPAGIP